MAIMVVMMGRGEDDGTEGLEKAYEKVLRTRDELNDTYGTEDSFFASEVSIESARGVFRKDPKSNLTLSWT